MTPEMDDEEIERVVDINRDGELTAEAQERLQREGGPVYDHLGSDGGHVQKSTGDDVSPVDIGTDAAPQLHIIEMDNGHRAQCAECSSTLVDMPSDLADLGRLETISRAELSG